MADQYYEGVGRRKTSTARVRLYPVSESGSVVNDKPLQEYFSREVDIVSLMGIARALLALNPELRPQLRQGGFLTRNALIKERKKPGLRRARKAPQYTKR